MTTRSEAISYLTQCADRNGKHWSGGYEYPAADCPTCDGTNDAGWLRTPGSRYGSTSAECATVAYQLAEKISEETGETISYDSLDHAMSLVVNDHDDVAELLQRW